MGETEQQRRLRELRGAVWTRGNDPASVGGTVRKRCVTDAVFADQVQAMWSGIDDQLSAAAFLAGVRFAQGYVEYGSGVFAMEPAQLLFEEAQEDADALVYQTIRRLPDPIRDALANPKPSGVADE